VAAGIARRAWDPDSDVSAYNILLLKHGARGRVSVDSPTGQLIDNPAMLDW
jgi:hypothetical protein